MSEKPNTNTINTTINTTIDLDDNQTNQTNQINQEDQDNLDQTNINNQKLFINQNLFVTMIVTIVTTLSDRAKQLIKDNKVNQDKVPSFNKLIKTSEDIVSEYKKDDKTSVDQAKIIKKVFYTLRDNLDLLKNKDNKLFTVRNKEGKITTIVPGINISLLVDHLNEEETKTLWMNIYTLFVTAVDMIYSNTDKSRHKQDVLDAVVHCKTELGTLNQVFKNYFLGLQSDNNVTMEALMSDDIVLPGTNVKGNLLTSLGINNLMNMDNLSDEIKKFSDDDVNETISTITNMFNSGGDSDVNDVCSTMVKTVLDDLKENGLNNMFDIASRVSGKLQNKLDVNKMEKTAGFMNNFMQNSSDKLKDLKDENGNPVGDKLLSQFDMMMSMAKMFKK